MRGKTMNHNTLSLWITLCLLAPLEGHAWGPHESGLQIRDLASGVSSQSLILDMDVTIQVTGPIARARVVQRFRNDSDDFVTGVYVFPLPSNAAVDKLRMHVGGRVFEGEIEERRRAKRQYLAALEGGKRASLVEQERPNLFTTSVANIGPGEDIEVEIEYQELLRYSDGRFELHFPMTLTPRYVAGRERVSFIPASGAPGWGLPTDSVADAHRITPPSVEPGDQRGCLVDLVVDVDAGLPLARFESPSHSLKSATSQGQRARIALHAIPADRDFILRWWPEVGNEPRAAIFHQQHDGAHYVMATVFPPSQQAAPDRLSRELVFVIDTSGSMAGTSIEQARAALQHALRSLTPNDYLNIIRFDNHHDALFDESRPADEETLRIASRFVRSMEAHGGTEMFGAIAAALEDPRLAVDVRQVVFVTDGAVADEASLFRLIEERLGRTRLFPVGIGSAPNRHFLGRAARFGRGTSMAITKATEVSTRMDELLGKIERPVLPTLDVNWNDEVEMWPARLPDVYTGEPIVVTARLPRLVGDIQLSARRSEAPWQARLPLAESHLDNGVAKLWARRKIAALMDARHRGLPADEARRQITETALRYHLVSRYTSLVAVDRTPTRPMHTPVSAQALPTMLPAGTHAQSFTGVLPATATAGPFLLYVGMVCCLLSASGLRILGRLR
jgi:Ca-activated chloride channel family protein